MFGFFQNLGPIEIAIIIGIVVFLFGGKKLSEFAQNLRQSKKEFKNIKNELNGTSEAENSS